MSNEQTVKMLIFWASSTILHRNQMFHDSFHCFSGKPRRGMLRRAVFSDYQRKGLEKRFQVQKYISKPDRKKLAEKLGLKDSQVRKKERKKLSLAHPPNPRSRGRSEAVSKGAAKGDMELPPGKFLPRSPSHITCRL